MFTVSNEQMAALGEGVALLDGDSVYITNGSWLIIVTGAQNHFDQQFMNILYESKGNSFVDWRVLNTSEIFWEEKKFIPKKSHKSVDIYSNGYKYSSFTAEGTRGLIEKNPEVLWGDCYKLDQIFAEGRVSTKYVKTSTNSRRTFSSEPSAKNYMFDMEGRQLFLNASWFRAFYEMDFEVNCPKDPATNPPSIVGVYKKDTEPDIFGYIATLTNVSDRKSRDGRPLYADVGWCSWKSPEYGLELLRDSNNYVPGDSTNIFEIMKLDKLQQHALNGISILRWHDLTDEQIDVLWNEGRESAMHVLHMQANSRVAKILSGLKESPPNSEWDLSRTTRELADLGKTLEDLQTEIPDVDLGKVREARLLLKECA